MMSAAETTIFVTTVGDQVNFADCMEHLAAQTVQRPIDVIDHVAPMSAAFQQMHDRCTTRFYVQVDEDMILFPHAIARLEELIAATAENVAMVCAPLWDCDTDQAIYGLKVYRHAIVRQFPYEDRAGCDMRQLARLRAAGYQVELLPLGDRSSCLGEHGKHYTPETIFTRWQRIVAKHERLGHAAWVEPWAGNLLRRYLASRERLDLYAFLGCIAGITGEPTPDREADWREPNRQLERIQRYFPPCADSENR